MGFGGFSLHCFQRCIILLPTCDMLKVFGSFIVFFAILSIPQSVIAAYVLPYPSYMPGHKLYRVARFMDEVKRFWYWGSLSSYRYYQAQSDKALVEAKTLFEYNQYLLGVEALQRSNRAAKEQNTYLLRAEKEGKDMHQVRQTVSEAMSEHEGLLKKLMEELPPEFVWQPEKHPLQLISLREDLKRAITIRKDVAALAKNE